MALTQTNLDDRTFDQLATEARALIPRYFPAWTDYNPSDPGITLLELFAFLVEAAIYQINRVPERSLEHFARLVGIQRQANEPIGQTLRRALEALQQQQRAVTEADFEELAKAADTRVGRCKAAIELSPERQVFPVYQYVTVIPVVKVALDAAGWLLLRQRIFNYLAPRRLITTRLRITPPAYTPVQIDVTVARATNSQLDQISLKNSVEQALRTFLDPIAGGVDGTGWPFGRPVYRSELDRLIEGLSGVDHVERLLLNGQQEIGQIPLDSQLSLVEIDELSVTVL